MTALSFVLATGLGVIACGGDNKANPDAPNPPKPDAAAPDAFVAPPCEINTCDEGGEIRLEWIETDSKDPVTGVVTAKTTSRMGAYFYKDETPATNPIPSFPGCVDMSAHDLWPLAQGVITPLDVGDVIVHPNKTGNDYAMLRDETGLDGGTATCDAFGRCHDLWWNKPKNPGTPGDGDTYLAADQSFNILFTGSAEWPAQVFNASPFMPAAWHPTMPAVEDTATLTADTDFVMDNPQDTTADVPPGYEVNTFVGFTANGSAKKGPVVACQFTGTPGTITVPAAMVNVILQNATADMTGKKTGTYVRQHLTHHVEVLTDGTPVADPTHRKRIDVFAIWCFNSNWANP